MTESIIRELMERSIEESKKSISEDKGIHPYVGAILSDDSGNVLLTSYRGEIGNGDHAEFILTIKAKKENIDLSDKTLFVTLEPCVARGPKKIPCYKHILKSGIKKVYIGMLDPNPLICGRGETFLRKELDVERFPGALISRIQEINIDFIGQFQQKLLPDNSLYVSKQISEIIIDFLKREGIPLDHIPFEWDINVDDVIHYIKSNFPAIADSKLHKLFDKARGYAFDKKYLDYTYEKDVRGLDEQWLQKIKEILKKFHIYDIAKRKVIVVGIGNGEEGKTFYKNIENLIIVDIASKSLEIAHKILSNSNKVVTSAENLIKVQDSSQDIYLSFRTFQSSYFSKSRAIREAYRVLRYGGILLISIANGYFGEGDALIPGLVIPGTKVVDKNRPYELLDSIRKKISNLGFEDIGISSTISELYIYGRKSR